MVALWTGRKHFELAVGVLWVPMDPHLVKKQLSSKFAPRPLEMLKQMVLDRFVQFVKYFAVVGRAQAPRKS